MVLITRCPNSARPATIPKPPRGRIQGASVVLELISPPLLTTLTTAANGPIALATSFEPWANAIQQAVTTISSANTFSTLAACRSASSEPLNFIRPINHLPKKPNATAIAIASTYPLTALSSKPTCLRPFLIVTSDITKPANAI